MRVIYIDSAEYDIIADRVCDEFCFDSQNENWLTLPGISRKFRLGNLWDEKQEKLVRELFIEAGQRELIAVDIHHDFFEFDLLENIPYGYWFTDEQRDCNVYFPSFYPNGDYYFFFNADMTCGLFGHPWREEIYVLGDDLVRLFEQHSEELGIVPV